MHTMTTLATPQVATTWNIDPAHSVAEFKVKHMMISNVKGQFAKVSGTLTLDESELTNSRIDALIEAASIETRDAQRDAHLKSPDFFDVEKFPTLAFKSSRISLVRDGELAVDGDLTIRGLTRKVTFKVEGPTPPAKDPWGNTRVAVSATTKINRKDFGLTWNAALETGGIPVASAPRNRDDHLRACRLRRTRRQPGQPGENGSRRRAMDDRRQWHPPPGDAQRRPAWAHARFPVVGEPALLAEDDRSPVPGYSVQRDSRGNRRRRHSRARYLRRVLGQARAGRRR